MSTAALPNLGVGPAVVCFDVGGTEIKSALVDETGSFLEVRRTPTVLDSAAPAVSLVALLSEVLEQYRAAHPELEIVTAGVSVPGIVDEIAGVGVFASNLLWRNAPIRQLAEDAFGIDVTLMHDTRTAARAECVLGAADGFEDVVVMVIGTGIAGAIISGGTPIVGGGYAAELGHSSLNLAGAECACGAHGCLETLASAGAISRRYAERTGGGLPGAKAVLEASVGGDPIATEIWHDAIEALALHCAQLVAIVAPEAIVISGGLAEAGDALFVPLAERLEAALSFHRRPKLVRGSLGANAGLIGTALTAREHAQRAPGELA